MKKKSTLKRIIDLEKKVKELEKQKEYVFVPFPCQPIQPVYPYPAPQPQPVPNPYPGPYPQPYLPQPYPWLPPHNPWYIGDVPEWQPVITCGSTTPNI